MKNVALALGLLSSTTAEASCLNPNADSRLRTLCVAETLAGSAVTINDAVLLDTLLKREGYADGIGLPNQVTRNSYEPYITPIIDYSTNINGGNPNRPLTLGNFEFTGDDANLKREGIIGGIGAGVSGRSIIGEGRYFDYGVNVSYAHSPEHDIGITRRSANVCSRNHIENNWFVDACADASGLERELAKDSTQGLSISTAKLFSTGNGAFHSVNIGVRRNFAEAYEQNHLQLGLSTVRNNSFYSSVNVAFGEAVVDTLVMRHSINTTVGTTLFDRALTTTLGYSFSDGGKLLGFEREDTTRNININYAITPMFSVGVGYRQNTSSINYFDEAEPVFSVQLAPVRF
jgi:hypothetical protein